MVIDVVEPCTLRIELRVFLALDKVGVEIISQQLRCGYSRLVVKVVWLSVHFEEKIFSTLDIPKIYDRWILAAHQLSCWR
jgi:hypothetical protein